ncbi:bisdemethoxycurcumin synthase-like [Setaria viridis]|uniref:bisdemethoxycurcumin synthase-like n=1 Tax=Setaria viridis TaxID=4556 RepID=UPI003B3BC136
MMATVLEENQPAAMLAISTANPANCLLQEEFPDWYFRVTRSDHLAKLKAKMKRMCTDSGIRKRHLHHTEEMIGSHPGFLDLAVPSLGARMRITDDAVPELAAAAAAKAIAEWGRPAADITHLVLSTNSSAVSPGPDLRVATLHGLRPTVQRTVLYLHGCSAGCSALRLAKDIAESIPGARVLAVSADVSVSAFRALDEVHLDADGAGAVIIGAEPVTDVERVALHMVAAAQATLPGTDHAVSIRLGESGVEYHMSAELSGLSGAWWMRRRPWVEAAAGMASCGRRTSTGRELIFHLPSFIPV